MLGKDTFEVADGWEDDQDWDTDSDSDNDADKDMSPSSSLSVKVRNLWRFREKKIMSDYAICGWMHCVLPNVMEQVVKS